MRHISAYSLDEIRLTLDKIRLGQDVPFDRADCLHELRRRRASLVDQHSQAVDRFDHAGQVRIRERIDVIQYLISEYNLPY